MAAIHLAGLVATMVFVVVVLPRAIFPLRRIEGTFLDRAVAGFVLFAAVCDAVMYVLGLIGALETLPLIAIWVALWWWLKGRGRREGPALRHRLASAFFAVADRAEDVGTFALGTRTTRGASRSSRRSGGGPALHGLPSSGALVVVLGLAAALRFRYALAHLELVPEDSYLALSLTKLVRLGTLMGEGTYPHGLYFWMSILDRFYPFGTYELTRFLGPVTGLLSVVAVYWAVSRISRSRAAGLAAAIPLGLFAGHPWLLVVWPRQIGPMPMEFAIAIGLVSLAYASRYLASRRRADLVLAMASLYAAVTTHALVIPLLAVGYASVVATSIVFRAWTPRTIARVVGLGLAAVAAGHVYFPVGLALGVPLQQAFELYDPTNPGTFVSALGPVATPGFELANNRLFFLGTLGGIFASLAGAGLWVAGRRHGAGLAATGVTVASLLLAYDFVFARLGPLFRTRMSWLAGELIVVGLGLGIGACVSAASELTRSGDLLSATRRLGLAGRRLAFESTAIVLVVVLCATQLAPTFPAEARDVEPSGYRQATAVSLSLIESEERLRYTFVGVSEQLQEVMGHGFFIEAWVFARDVAYADAANPAFELPVPTPTIYVFAEKEAFLGPQVIAYGPTAEFYRNVEKRSRIMRRVVRWCELYAQTHGSTQIVYEDDQLRVYQIRRPVDLERAARSDAFKDYRWRPGELFTGEASVEMDRVA